MGSMTEVLEMEQPDSAERAVAAPAPKAVAVIPTTPFELVAHAAARGASMDELRTFIELQERLEANQARKAYVAAMAEFKRNPPQIMKDKAVGYYNKDGSFTGYRHSTLGAVCGAVVEALGTHGFSHRWDTEQPDSGMIAVTCAITHAMGHCETTRMVAPPDNSGKKNAIQQVASTITYLQRYTLLAACGLATNEQLDDDGRGASDIRETEERQQHEQHPAKLDPAPDLVAAAKAAAAMGVAIYEAFWTATGIANRKLLAQHHDTFKAEAVAADQARTAGADATGVTDATAPELSDHLKALLNELVGFADAGPDAFNQAWNRLSKATQDSLASQHTALVARAAASGVAA